METVHLIRHSSDLFATLGVLSHSRGVLCHTLELPWRYNGQGKSCIPAGTYECERVDHARLGRCFHVLDVPGRLGILIHVGNNLDDTSGCILVGLDTDYHSVLKSRLAMDRLMISLPFQFYLQVRDA